MSVKLWLNNKFKKIFLKSGTNGELKRYNNRQPNMTTGNARAVKRTNKGEVMNKKKNVRIILLIVFAGIMLNIFVVGGIVFIWFIPEIFHYDRYKGEYPHLYTVAINSVLTNGYIGGFENYGAAEIYKLDEDEFGRELFIYSGSPIALAEEYHGANSILICQKHDEQYSYWYDNDNYILAPHYGYVDEKYNGVYDDIYKGITDEQIEALKELNDWGKEIDEEKLSSAKIVRDPQGSSGDRKKARSFYDHLFEESGYDHSWQYNAMCDKDGRAIYCISGVNREEGYIGKCIIAIMSPQGEFYEDEWFIYDSPKNYAEDLKRIKEAVGWNMKAE